MIALDTSVAVAAVVGWHEAHDVAVESAADASIPAHALLEAYSVLTRLPMPHRIAPGVAAELLTGWFPGESVLVPGPELVRATTGRLAAADIIGGAAHDGLIALTAHQHQAELITRDGRAARTYDALGVPFRLLR